MIKKLLSFIAFSAMLISPVMADEFVGLGYYESDTTYSLPQTQIKSYPVQSNVMMARVPLPRGCTSFANLNSECVAIRNAILSRNIPYLQFLLRNSVMFSHLEDDIISSMQKDDIYFALQILEEYDTGAGFPMEFPQLYEDNDNLSDSKYKNNKFWEKHHIDVHEFKDRFLGSGGAKFDMYLHNTTGEILLKRHNSSIFIRTGEYIK